MERFLRLFAKYALAAALIFVLQWWFPIPFGFVMFLGGLFWIGILVHVFMIHITTHIV